MQSRSTLNYVWIALAVIGLVAVYIFQRFNYSSLFSTVFPYLGSGPNIIFITNRVTRFFLNEALCVILIYLIFQKREYLKLSLWVFCFESMVLLPAYLYFKLTLEGDSEISSPLLSTFHRMIVNPLLMFILMLGFFYQKHFYSSRK